MSSAARRSIDNAPSPRPTSSSSQYPFPQYDVLQRPGTTARYGGRRGSGASSITSIGGILDPAAQGGDNAIAETNSNGMSFRDTLNMLVNIVSQLSQLCCNLTLYGRGFCRTQSDRMHRSHHRQRTYRPLLLPTSLMSNHQHSSRISRKRGLSMKPFDVLRRATMRPQLLKAGACEHPPKQTHGQDYWDRATGGLEVCPLRQC